MKIVYNGPYPGVVLDKIGKRFPKGQPVEVDAATAKRLLKRPVFSEASSPSKTPTPTPTPTPTTNEKE